MNLQNIYTQLQQLSFFEVAGFVTSLAGVWLAARQNVLTWPVGLVGVLLSLVVFYRERLFADVVLQLFYVGTTAFGWYQWLYGSKQHSELKVAQTSANTIWLTLLLGAVLSPVAGFLFAEFTAAAVPYLDSALAVFSVLATVLMGRKLIEHWFFWIVLDLIYTGLYFYKQLYLYSLLYFIFTLLAIMGYREWRLSLATKTAAA